MPARMPLGVFRTRPTLRVFTLAVVVSVVFGGCSSFRNKEDDNAAFKKLLTAPDPPSTIGEAAVPYGMTYARVQGVGVVNGLPRTGAPAIPSELRDRLIAEMKTHDVRAPEKYLESHSTALVVTEAIMPPGIKRGDVLDVGVRVPARSDVGNLSSGWLMPSRLQEIRRLDGTLRSSDVAVIGTGSVLVRGQHEGNGQEMMLEGTILGGGIAQVDRPVGLVIRPEYQHVLLSAQFAKNINRRFYFFDGSTRRGIATPREDDFVEIDVLPRYEHNVHRLIAVVRSISVDGDDQGLHERLGNLAEKLREPTTAAAAALSLEAIGPDAVPVLVEALQTSDPEIRFYVAEALAYLDHEAAIEPLTTLARSEPAFRHPALKALEGMPQPAATEALRALFNESSNELRYGAYTTLRSRPDAAGIVAGQRFGKAYSVHSLPSTAETLIAVSLFRRAEIVIFGTSPEVSLLRPAISRGGIVISPDAAGQLQLSRFVIDKEDRKATAPADVASVCAAVAALGGNYGDCVDVLRTLKAEDAIAARLAFDPAPRPLRTYYREEESGESDGSPKLGPQDITPPPPKEPTLLEKLGL
ncbi:HEAT repeat domain-containing protein [Roseimaritima sediminicola]|uniref:HEAT repeat domain-containing protein n=1 Tax=Roseimaritima sediminicola TaxID=2662066 RepID=UPI0012983D50|nr:HEAT repeat domain-containing protein [Roseimaritima sediminicola]